VLRNLNISHSFFSGTPKKEETKMPCPWLHLNTPSLDHALKHIEKYLETVRKKHPTAKLALVFDIDDTVLLDNGPNKRQTVLKGMQHLFHRARELNYGLFFITARPDRNDNFSHTKRQLQRTGFGDYTKLFLMPPQFRAANQYSAFKYLMRHQIEKEGYQIVLNCGDSMHDLLVLPDVAAEKTVSASTVKKLNSLPPDNYILFSPNTESAWLAMKMPNRSK
jgi:predicted secreted acid phosphatase